MEGSQENNKQQCLQVSRERHEMEIERLNKRVYFFANEKREEPAYGSSISADRTPYSILAASFIFVLEFYLVILDSVRRFNLKLANPEATAYK